MISARISGLAFAALSCSVAHAQLTNQDDCSGALFDVVGPGAYDFDLSQASGIAQSPCATIISDIWFTYLATRTGMTTVHTCSSGSGTVADTVIQAWQGTTCPPAGTPIECSDQACNSNFSSITFPATAGQSYLVQVGHFAFGGFAGTGTVEIVEPQCFSDRVSWEDACGGPSSFEEGFQGFNVDTPFEGVQLPIAVGTIEAVNGTGFRNLVDVPPFLFNDNNGTNHASCFVNADPPATNVVIRTNVPVEGFGAALSGATSGEMAELAVFREQNLIGVCAVASNDINQFVGFVGDNSLLDRVELRAVTLNPGPGGEGFGMDRIVTCVGGTGPIGTLHCLPAAPNSTGVAAEISAVGSSSAAAMDVLLTADELPPGQFGHFFASRTPGFIPNPGNPPSQGNVCVTGNIGRYNCAPCGQIGAGPTFSLQVGHLPVPVNPPEMIMAGDTWYWQFWYRDAGNNTNFSPALGITFTP